MPGRSKRIVDIRAMLHQLRQGASNREVARALGMDRRVVGKYRRWAKEQGLLEGELPEMGELQRLVKETLGERLPPQNSSSVEPYREVVERMRKEGVEMAAIWERLQERGYEGSYGAVWRFVRRLEPQTPEVVVRVECRPGEEGQVDFGFAGMMQDPETGTWRRTWAFVMVLSWSRHQYVEFVFDQSVSTWLRCHQNAFAYFGGTPERVVLDNLKAAIIKACFDDPEIQQAYGECAEHYGFRIAPNRVRTPQHKGKVEQGGVHYVKRNFLGGREPTDIRQANRDVRVWCDATAGQRVHGTIKEQPLQRFQEVEKAALQPLPATNYDLAVWKTAKVHRDGHIVFDKAFYSAPCRLVGQTLRVRGGTRDVRLYTQDYELVTTHERAKQAGARQTNLAHLPPEKLPGLLWDRETCQALAQEVGPATAQVVAQYLADPIIERLRTVHRLLRLREAYGDQRLEAACQRALRFEDGKYKTIKRILVTAQEGEPDPPQPIPAPAQVFVRSAVDLFGQMVGGLSWN